MISIIILTFATEDFIEETIKSIVNQTSKSFEALFMAHKKDKKVVKILEEYSSKYPYIKIVWMDEDHGPGFDRNKGITESQYPYIHFLDGDDLLNKHFITDYIREIEVNPNIDIFMGNTLYFYDLDWKNLPKNNFEENIYLIKDAPKSSLHIAESWQVAYHAKVYKKSFLQERNIYFPNKKIIYDDFILFQIINFQKEKVKYSYISNEEYYTLYRNRENSTINNPVSGSAYYVDIYRFMLKYQEENKEFINIFQDDFYMQYFYSFRYSYSQGIKNKVGKKGLKEILQNKNDLIDIFGSDIINKLKLRESNNFWNRIWLSKMDVSIYRFFTFNKLYKKIFYFFISFSFLRPKSYFVILYFFNKKMINIITKLSEKSIKIIIKINKKIFRFLTS